MNWIIEIKITKSTETLKCLNFKLIIIKYIFLESSFNDESKHMNNILPRLCVQEILKFEFEIIK